jgi:hypothetical protein
VLGKVHLLQSERFNCFLDYCKHVQDVRLLLRAVIRHVKYSCKCLDVGAPKRLDVCVATSASGKNGIVIVGPVMVSAELHAAVWRDLSLAGKRFREPESALIEIRPLPDFLVPPIAIFALESAPLGVPAFTCRRVLWQMRLNSRNQSVQIFADLMPERLLFFRFNHSSECYMIALGIVRLWRRHGVCCHGVNFAFAMWYIAH